MSGKRTLQSKEPHEQECGKVPGMLVVMVVSHWWLVHGGLAGAWGQGVVGVSLGGSVTAGTKKMPKRRSSPRNPSLYPNQGTSVTVLFNRPGGQ